MITRKQKSKGKEYEYNSFEIYGLSTKLAQELENIAANLGHKSLSAFLRPELRKIRDSYPENMRQDPSAA